jgi:Ca2+/Na+ antiporter
MNMAGYTRRYRFFGIELRIFFWLIAVLLLIVAIAGFRSSIWLSMFFFLIAILLVFFIRLDSSYHLVITTPETLIFENVVWRRLTTAFVHVPWGDVEKVTTIPWGPFNLMKSTRIESKGRKPIKVFSFMEDYLHFLRDLVNQAKSAEVDKLTSDLPAGRADL